MPYKIRRKSDGMFSSGGNYPYFDTAGKTWDRIGPVKAHLTMLTSSGYLRRNFPDLKDGELPDDWEVVRGDFVVLVAAPAQLVPGDKCVNCKRVKKEHKKGKCLFEPTEYSWSGI